MTSADVVQSREQITLVCNRCGSRQPGFPVAVIELSGSDCSLETALRQWAHGAELGLTFIVAFGL